MPPLSDVFNASAGHGATLRGVEQCWETGLSEEACCNLQRGPRGQDSCWNEFYTFELCCPTQASFVWRLGQDSSSCWKGGTFYKESCCNLSTSHRGDTACWSGPFTFETCCPVQVEVVKELRKLLIAEPHVARAAMEAAKKVAEHSADFYYDYDSLAEDSTWEATEPQWRWQPGHTGLPHCRREPAYLLQRSDEFLTIDKGEVKMNYAKHQHHTNFWERHYASWEPRAFDIYRRFAKDRITLDIGAWVGVTSLWMANVAKKVIALEPSPSAFAELCANYAVNAHIHSKIVLLNAALDAADGSALLSDLGKSTDHLIKQGVFKGAHADVGTMKIATLELRYPELAYTGFVKVDIEGYELVVVPALEMFLRRVRPTLYLSLHPGSVDAGTLQRLVEKLEMIFPFLYEADMTTPFRAANASLNTSEHAGADILCTWERLTPVTAPS
eukprot:TRINITY_DN31836_c0_g1_i2.p1 TRINITY_DN31836_c0_g1~~TRINITY_DN31836_c0_g1_i2.p1  ORF type:complete len:443 (-),score=55.20 TRINITY_DN31836_c0_g1_i2:701-2029(-)